MPRIVDDDDDDEPAAPPAAGASSSADGAGPSSDAAASSSAPPPPSRPSADDDDDDIFMDEEAAAPAPAPAPAAKPAAGGDDDDEFAGLPSDEDEAQDSEGEEGEGGDDSDDSGDDSGEEGGEEGEGEGGAAAEGDDDDDDDVVVRKKGKKRARQQLEMDEDDYELVKENTGVDLQASKGKRLKHGGDGASGIQVEGADVEEAGARLAGELFGGDAADEEEAPEEAPVERDEEIRDDDDVDDFIEYADGEQRPRRRAGKTEEEMEMQQQREDIFGTDQELQELLQFSMAAAAGAGGEGDGEDGAAARPEYVGAFDGSDDDDDDDEDEMEGFIDDGDDEEAAAARAEKRARKKKRGRRAGGPPSAAVEARMRAMYDPEALKAAFITDADEAIRRADVPERLQACFADRPPLTKEELEEEGQWIYQQLFVEALKGDMPKWMDQEHEVRTTRPPPARRLPGVSGRPSRASTLSLVASSTLGMCNLPPAWKSRTASAWWPSRTASCNGVPPHRSLTFKSAPLARSSSQTEPLPTEAARWRHVRPS